MTGTAVPRNLSQVTALGDEVVPVLANHSPVRFLGAKGQLERSARSVEPGNRRFYVAPPKGLTGDQYLLARAADGVVVQPAVQVGSGGHGVRLAQGQIVVLSLPRDHATWGRLIDSFQLSLRDGKLGAVPVGLLLGRRAN